MHVKLLLGCTILPTDYFDNTGYLKKLKKANTNNMEAGNDNEE